MNLREQALSNLTKASNLQKLVILNAFKERGSDEVKNIQSIEDYDEIPYQKLVEPSIFDDEEVKLQKSILIDI